MTDVLKAAREATPPDPEDLPHPGTGRLLSASPVKPPEPACVCPCNDAGTYYWGCPKHGHPDHRAAIKKWEAVTFNPPQPPEPAPYVEASENFSTDEQELGYLRAQLAAAQARVKELEEDVAALGFEESAATKRAEKAERELLAARDLSEFRAKHNAKLALERDAAMEGGTQAVWKLRCSRWESKAALMQNERDAAIKAKEEAEQEAANETARKLFVARQRDAAEATAGALRAALEGLLKWCVPFNPCTDPSVERAREALAAHAKAVGP